MKLLLSALATLLAAPILADGNVTVYGQANVAVVYNKNFLEALVGGTQTNVGMMRIDSQTSRIGFRGEETLDGDLKAFFKIETGAGLDNASATSFASREGWVGLKGGFGTVWLGRGKSIYTQAYEDIDFMYGIFDVGLSGYNTTGRDSSKLDDGISYRVSNVLRYTYNQGPWFAGAEIALGEDKNATHDARREVNATVKYKTSDWWAAAAIDNVSNVVQRYNPSTTSQSGHLNNWLVGTGMYLGPGSIHIMFQRHAYDEPGYQNRRNSFQLAGTYDMVSANVYGDIIWNGKLQENGATRPKSDNLYYGFGVAVPLSKRTVWRTEFGQIHFADSARWTQTYSMSGLFHSF
ncbi:porin [Chitinimonas sp.]|uniref:porin n=1 Tax=Chitinimonas sp. TaxID=1934313 RepID=UPI0035AE4461